MATAYMKKVVVAAEYAAIEAARTVVNCEISCPPANVGNVTFKVGGSEVEWIAGEYHSFRELDLSSIQVKGTPGDVITVIGEAD